MTTPASLAIEIDLDRAEATLLSGDTAWLASPAAARLADRARSSSDPHLSLRGRVLARLALDARIAADPHVVAAQSAPRTLDGLALRYTALRAARARHGFVDDTPPLPPPPSGSLPPWPPYDGPVPSAVDLISSLAAAHGLSTAGIDLHTGAASSTITISPGHARISIGPSADALATLALTMHEAGHALYRAQQRGMSLLAAAPPSRTFDEAIAAWAVRSLEDPLLIPNPTIRSVSLARRTYRESLTLRLAHFETAALSGTAITTAWSLTGLLTPSAFPSLFTEPGTTPSYALADHLHLAPNPGDILAWSRGQVPGS
jgi:hypothetical protein